MKKLPFTEDCSVVFVQIIFSAYSMYISLHLKSLVYKVHLL